MQNAPDIHSIVEAAERAANARDYASAERLLRQAARMQETSLGGHHPDLANTLNNLAVVLDSAGNATDAEACYRRAYAIATAALPPDHPLVVTSGQNLREFCAAQGQPFEQPPPPELAEFGAEPTHRKPTYFEPAYRDPVLHEPVRHEPVLHEPTRLEPVRASAVPVATPRRFGGLGIGIGAAIVAAIALVWYVASANEWFRSSPAETPSQAAAPPPPSEAVPPPVDPTAPSLEAPAVEQAPPAPAEAAQAEANPAAASALEKPSSPEPAPSAPSVAGASVTVVEARLCRALSPPAWDCTEAPSPSAPGRFFFYTRLRSARDTRVEHRWYREGTLVQNVALRIGANQGAGYRTYSRNTIVADRAGNWRVELRSTDGALLHEKDFVVR